jgi:hypothetical protein
MDRLEITNDITFRPTLQLIYYFVAEHASNNRRHIQVQCKLSKLYDLHGDVKSSSCVELYC